MVSSGPCLPMLPICPSGSLEHAFALTKRDSAKDTFVFLWRFAERERFAPNQGGVLGRSRHLNLRQILKLRCREN